MKALFTVTFILAIATASLTQKPYSDKKISVLELRNYVIKEGGRDNFIDSFRVYIEDSQNVKGAYVLGKYHVKGAKDNYFWFRGFADMPSRQKALEAFYSSPYWQKTSRVSAEYVVNFHNVHLLKPVNITTGDTLSGFNASWFDQPKGIAVIDFYIGNHRRNEVIEFFRDQYHARLREAGVRNISYWIAEDEPNNYPQHPVFQNNDLLVSVSFFKNEKEFDAAMKKISGKTREEFLKVVTLHEQLIITPAR